MKLNKAARLYRHFVSIRVYNTNFCESRKIFAQTCAITPIGTFSAPFSTSLKYNYTMNEGDRKDLNLSYDDILKAQNDESVLIIDVREQSEIDETGKLPGSVHIPMGVVVSSFNLSEQEFKKKFDREKPTKDTKIILSCRSGKRSNIVQEEIQKLGYENAYNYIGGWLDWERNQKV